MPVDDNPLDTAVNDAPKQTTTDARMGVAEVTQIVGDALQPIIDQMGVQNQQTSAQFEQIASVMQQQTQPAPTDSAVAGEDFLTELTSGNGEAAVAKIVRQEMSGITGIIGKTMQSASSAFVDLGAQEVDQQFGDGAYEQFFAKSMETIMAHKAKNDPAAYADSAVIRSEIAGLKGHHFDELVKFRDESRKNSSEEENEKLRTMLTSTTDAVLNRVNGSGGLRRINPDEQVVTPELQGYLDDRTRGTGIVEDPKEWLKKRFDGKTINDYNTHIKKSNGAAS